MADPRGSRVEMYDGQLAKAYSIATLLVGSRENYLHFLKSVHARSLLRHWTPSPEERDRGQESALQLKRLLSCQHQIQQRPKRAQQ
jgi:hypothetical protein